MSVTSTVGHALGLVKALWSPKKAKKPTDDAEEENGAGPATAAGAATPGMIASSPIPTQRSAGNGASTPMIASATASPVRSSKRRKRDSEDDAAYDDGEVVVKKMIKNVRGAPVAVAVAMSSPLTGNGEAVAVVEPATPTSPSGKGGTATHNKSFLETLFSPVYSLLTPFVGGRGKDVKVAAAVAAAATTVTTSTTTTTVSDSTVAGAVVATTAAARATVRHEEDSKLDDTEQEESDESSDEQGWPPPFDPWVFIREIPPLGPEWSNRPAVLPKRTRHSPPFTLVLDLDETLVHCSTSEPEDKNYDTQFPVTTNGVDYMVFVRIRPHMKEFLERVSEIYEIVLFTASLKIYADKLLNILDPDKELIQHRLFRNDCVYVGGNYVKDLSILGRSLAKTMIVDNSPQAFAYQLSNGVPIESWYEDEDDTCLLDLLPFLEGLVTDNVRDVRTHVKREFKLHELVEDVANFR